MVSECALDTAGEFDAIPSCNGLSRTFEVEQQGRLNSPLVSHYAGKASFCRPPAVQS
jgi:hypothetical protein